MIKNTMQYNNNTTPYSNKILYINS